MTDPVLILLVILALLAFPALVALILLIVWDLLTACANNGALDRHEWNGLWTQRR